MEKELEKEFKKDPIKTTLVDMTALGLVEVTRKKTTKTTHEQSYGWELKYLDAANVK